MLGGEVGWLEIGVSHPRRGNYLADLICSRVIALHGTTFRKVPFRTAHSKPETARSRHDEEVLAVKRPR
jgi:hypothetical protein